MASRLSESRLRRGNEEKDAPSFSSCPPASADSPAEPLSFASDLDKAPSAEHRLPPLFPTHLPLASPSSSTLQPFCSASPGEDFLPWLRETRLAFSLTEDDHVTEETPESHVAAEKSGDAERLGKAVRGALGPCLSREDASTPETAETVERPKGNAHTEEQDRHNLWALLSTDEGDEHAQRRVRSAGEERRDVSGRSGWGEGAQKREAAHGDWEQRPTEEMFGAFDAYAASAEDPFSASKEAGESLGNTEAGNVGKERGPEKANARVGIPLEIFGCHDTTTIQDIRLMLMRSQTDPAVSQKVVYNLKARESVIEQVVGHLASLLEGTMAIHHGEVAPMKEASILEAPEAAAVPFASPFFSSPELSSSDRPASSCLSRGLDERRAKEAGTREEADVERRDRGSCPLSPVAFPPHLAHVPESPGHEESDKAEDSSLAFSLSSVSPAYLSPFASSPPSCLMSPSSATSPRPRRDADWGEEQTVEQDRDRHASTANVAGTPPGEREERAEETSDSKLSDQERGESESLLATRDQENGKNDEEEGRPKSGVSARVSLAEWEKALQNHGAKVAFLTQLMQHVETLLVGQSGRDALGKNTVENRDAENLELGRSNTNLPTRDVSTDLVELLRASCLAHQAALAELVSLAERVRVKTRGCRAGRHKRPAAPTLPSSPETGRAPSGPGGPAAVSPLSLSPRASAPCRVSTSLHQRARSAPRRSEAEREKEGGLLSELLSRLPVSTLGKQGSQREEISLLNEQAMRSRCTYCSPPRGSSSPAPQPSTPSNVSGPTGGCSSCPPSPPVGPAVASREPVPAHAAAAPLGPVGPPRPPGFPRSPPLAPLPPPGEARGPGARLGAATPEATRSNAQAIPFSFGPTDSRAGSRRVPPPPPFPPPHTVSFSPLPRGCAYSPPGVGWSGPASVSLTCSPQRRRPPSPPPAGAASPRAYSPIEGFRPPSPPRGLPLAAASPSDLPGTQGLTPWGREGVGQTLTLTSRGQAPGKGVQSEAQMSPFSGHPPTLLQQRATGRRSSEGGANLAGGGPTTSGSGFPAGPTSRFPSALSVPSASPPPPPPAGVPRPLSASPSRLGASKGSQNLGEGGAAESEWNAHALRRGEEEKNGGANAGVRSRPVGFPPQSPHIPETRTTLGGDGWSVNTNAWSPLPSMASLPDASRTETSCSRGAPFSTSGAFQPPLPEATAPEGRAPPLDQEKLFLLLMLLLRSQGGRGGGGDEGLQRERGRGIAHSTTPLSLNSLASLLSQATQAWGRPEGDRSRVEDSRAREEQRRPSPSSPLPVWSPVRAPPMSPSSPAAKLLGLRHACARKSGRGEGAAEWVRGDALTEWPEGGAKAQGGREERVREERTLRLAFRADAFSRKHKQDGTEDRERRARNSEGGDALRDDACGVSTHSQASALRVLESSEGRASRKVSLCLGTRRPSADDECMRYSGVSVHPSGYSTVTRRPRTVSDSVVSFQQFQTRLAPAASQCDGHTQKLCRSLWLGPLRGRENLSGRLPEERLP
ncbi:hypothetical protein TGMAS_277060, partial [Toxoplasma gondii MAS]